MGEGGILWAVEENNFQMRWDLSWIDSYHWQQG